MVMPTTAPVSPRGLAARLAVYFFALFASVTTNWVDTPRGCTSAVARVRSRPSEIPAAFQEIMALSDIIITLIVIWWDDAW